MLSHQLALPLASALGKNKAQNSLKGTCAQRLIQALSEDLDFHGENTAYATHNFHAFPAKFPPQLPDKFITTLTQPGDVVFDPMSGSGTTIVEAVLHGRRAIACDIDPLALQLVRTKVTSLDLTQVLEVGQQILTSARTALAKNSQQLHYLLETRWDEKTKAFVDYWFAPQTQLELVALVSEIERIADPGLRAFFELALSAIIITKSGGVSLAFDLAHTRPHRAKQVLLPTGEVLYTTDPATISAHRLQVLTKTLRPAVDEFEKRIRRNLEGLITAPTHFTPHIIHGNAQSLPLPANFVDLIVTSPPYASNAIDYMRAHKFSLVWFGYPIDDLGDKRRTYIGGESMGDIELVSLPDYTTQVIADISCLDDRKGLVLHRYYSEMDRALREMFRVLKPGKAAVVVVGTSILRGRDTETHVCLANIGQSIGFDVPKIGTRHLDRNRRMMPAGMSVDRSSQIQQRMHEEYVIGFHKP